MVDGQPQGGKPMGIWKEQATNQWSEWVNNEVVKKLRVLVIYFHGLRLAYCWNGRRDEEI